MISPPRPPMEARKLSNDTTLSFHTASGSPPPPPLPSEGYANGPANGHYANGRRSNEHTPGRRSTEQSMPGRGHARTPSNGHGQGHSRTHSGGRGSRRIPSAVSSASGWDLKSTISIRPETATVAALNERLKGLREAGVRRVPVAKLAGEVARLRPALRARMPDLVPLHDCVSGQYPRNAESKDLALVLRASAVMRSLNEEGVREVTSLPWHMAQMFGAVSPPTANSTIYDFSPTTIDAKRHLGLDMIETPAPTLGLGLRVEFVYPHQFPTPPAIPNDNDEIMASRAAVRSFAANRGVLPGLTTTLVDGTWFPWLLTHVYSPTVSPAVAELDALTSLRMASRLTTRLYAAARQNAHHVPIPPVLTRTYALVAIGSLWTFYIGVLEGDLTVTEVATVNAADPEGLMQILGLVRAIASEAEERRHTVENWLYCLDDSGELPGELPMPLSPSAMSAASYGTAGTAASTAASPPPKYESPRAAPQIPPQQFRRVPVPGSASAPNVSRQSRDSRDRGHSRGHSGGAAAYNGGYNGQYNGQYNGGYNGSLPPSPATTMATNTTGVTGTTGTNGTMGTATTAATTATMPTTPTTPTDGTSKMGVAISPPSPNVAVGAKGRSPIKDVSVWRMAVRRPSAAAHRLTKSVS